MTDRFEAIPGQGVRASVGGRRIAVGSARLAPAAARTDTGERLRAAGKTLLYVDVDGEAAGVLAAADAEREEVPEALEALRRYGIEHIELLTGDNEQTASALATKLGLRYRADLLPEDKIEIVRQYQAEGKTVVMIGEGVNDAPALAQADVGIAMGAAGTDVAIEAAHVALLRDDWRLVPELFQITRRTMRVVRLNIGFHGRLQRRGAFAGRLRPPPADFRRRRAVAARPRHPRQLSPAAAAIALSKNR